MLNKHDGRFQTTQSRAGYTDKHARRVGNAFPPVNSIQQRRRSHLSVTRYVRIFLLLVSVGLAIRVAGLAFIRSGDLSTYFDLSQPGENRL